MNFQKIIVSVICGTILILLTLIVSRCQNLKGWLERCRETMPGYEENEKGAAIFGAFFTAKSKEVGAGKE